MEKLVLIDGNSLINRAFYAMPLLTTKNGIYTNAVYGFMNMFIKMIDNIKPTKIAVAFDVHAPTFRHLKYAEYKGTRKPMPEELRPQIPLLKEVLSLMGIKTIEKAGIEADDIIGTLAKNTSYETIIFTGDKDSFQLVDDCTSVHFTKRGITDTDIYTNSNFEEKMGIKPIQIIDLKALMGDASDNIIGVKGIGEKTAITLVQKYGTIENLYEHLSDFNGKLLENLQNGKDSAFFSKELATIKTDADFPYSIDELNYTIPFSEKVKEKFIELEFKSLYLKSELFAKDNITSQEKTSVSSKQKVEIEKVKSFPIDLKNICSLALLDDSVNMSDGKKEYEIKIKQTLLDDGFDLSTILNEIIPVFSNKNLVVYDKKKLRHFIFDCINKDIDINADDLSIIKYLADFSGKNETLKEVIISYNEDETTPSYSMLNIYKNLYDKLKEEKMLDLYLNVELPLVNVLYSMEQSGFKVDSVALEQTGEKYKTILSNYEKQIREIAGDENLNVNSPKQLGELLFEKLKIAKGKKTKTGYSTSAEVLEELEGLHPIVSKILEYRTIQKLYSTYVEGLRPLIDKKTGIIKTTFNQTVTTTGRLSSKEPNLQNIPVRDDEGKELRKFFVPKSSDRILVSADYSQIELRLLASFSNCKPLIDAFLSNEDIHAKTASKVFNVPIDKVDAKMRRDAKAVNFGVIYGISEYGLAKNIKSTPKEAKSYITSYFNEYPEVKNYMESNKDFAKLNGYAITMLNRRRYIKEISSSNYMLRSFGERAAMNMPLQGSAADIIKLAMLGVFNRLKKENLKSELILQVHDELIIDAYKSEQKIVEKILREEMENAVKLSVPLTVSLSSGETWYDAK
ncbi:MAG: DNA polymerase I [Clostridia bacterium]|nr:DNA polymerase I [Clostridia bacterium]